MSPEWLQQTFLDLATPHVADACMRIGVHVRCSPAEIRPLWSNMHLVGRVNPVRHAGSVDVFLEAIARASPGDVLIVDNGGWRDEACVGDLVTLQACLAGLSGIVIWGLHRDSTELRSIRLPIFSAGSLAVGPQRLDSGDDLVFTSANCRRSLVDGTDFALGDDDGVVFVPLDCAKRWRNWPARYETPRGNRQQKCGLERLSGLKPTSRSTWRPGDRTQP